MTKTTQPYPSNALKSSLPKQLLAGPSYNQATIATGQVGRHVVGESGLLENCVVNVGTCGTVGDTIAQFRRIPAGSSTPANIGAAFTVNNAAPDGTKVIVPLNIEVDVGDVIDLDVTTAPTGGANLAWTPNIARQFSSNP